jgi:AraC-like DNA-binding protein/quercetin dioxygenase-like cupin family protein
MPLAPTPLAPAHLKRVDDSTLPVVAGVPVNYPADHVIAPHHHNKNQLLCAVHGVMVVSSESGQWIVPPTRGIWMPAGKTHWLRCVGELHMRSLYIHPDAAPGLPVEPLAVGISPLLRELILAATQITAPYAADSRNGRLMRLLIDEIAILPILPLHLPQPTEPRIRRICAAIAAAPDDTSTLSQWAERLRIDAKTVQRLFARETGMTFGQWRQQARLLMALEQLATGAKVVDVALNLGYDSPSAFATMFKRQFGQTPSTFFR